MAFNLPLSLSAAADSWLLPGEIGQFTFNTTRQASEESRGIAALAPRSEQFGLKPYLEYSLDEDITVGLGHETRFVRSMVGEGRAGRTDGFLTTELFLRGRLSGQDWYAVSLQDLVQLPGQEAEPAASQSSLRLQYGRFGKLSRGTWNSTIKAGFQPSVDLAPETYKADLALGWRPLEGWQVTAQSLNALGQDRQDSKAQVAMSQSLNRSLSLQLGGWQALAGEAAGESGFDALIWLRL